MKRKRKSSLTLGLTLMAVFFFVLGGFFYWAGGLLALSAGGVSMIITGILEGMGIINFGNDK